MKQKLYIYAIIDAIIILTGAIFKIEHFPGAFYLLFLGLGGLVFFILPAGLISNYRNTEGNRSPVLHIVTWITCTVVFTAMLFKIQHWPGAGIALVIALPFPYIVFLPVYLSVTSKDQGFSIYNTVLVLMLLAVNSVFSAMLSLNVTYEKIADSYHIAGNYNKVESALDKTSGTGNPDIVLKIDAVLNTIDKYQEAILKYEGTSEQQWSAEPALLKPDSKADAYIALTRNGFLTPDDELDQRLSELMDAFMADTGLRHINESVFSIFGLEQAENKYFYPVAKVTYDNPLTWTLIWFDSLETNLKLIKASL